MVNSSKKTIRKTKKSYKEGNLTVHVTPGDAFRWKIKGKYQIKRVDNVWEGRRGERMDERRVSSCKTSAVRPKE
jgi:hypothetical protein